MSRCDSQSCILAQEEEQYLQTGDPQLTRHVLLCLLLIIGLFAVKPSLLLAGLVSLNSCLLSEEPHCYFAEVWWLGHLNFNI